jgi:hypothetical protein
MIAVARIKERAARTVILNNLRQLYDAKEFYFSSDPVDPKMASVFTLANKGFITSGLKDKLMTPRSYEAGLGWHYEVLVRPGDSVMSYQGVLSGSKPTGAAIYYPADPATGSSVAATAATAAVAAPRPPAAPAIGGVVLMPKITGATPLSANAQQAHGVPVGTQLVGLYMAGSDINQLAGTDPSRLPKVSAGYTNVGNSGYQYFEGSGVFGQLMPHMADNLRPLSPSERNAWDGGIAVFSDGSVARLEKVCNGNAAGGEKDYAYFSALQGVNANQGMAMLSGTAQPGQSVQVSHAGSVVGTVTADAQGHWTMAGPASLAGNSAGLTVTPAPTH